jgi:molybdate transport system substrate-binding protein
VSSINILSGGAAQGLVASLLPAFKKRTGLDIVGHFGAVGAMADKLREGVPTDIVILTAAIVAKLAEEKLVFRSSVAAIGAVETAIAVRAGDPRVSAGDADALRAALLAADAIFVPDTKASTAGIHVAKMLNDFGIADDVAARLKIFPNGATAMRHLAASDAAHPIGCTQATEIIKTEGVELASALPPGYELKTVYTAAIAARAAKAEGAQALINLLVARDQRDLRARAGFLAA